MARFPFTNIRSSPMAAVTAVAAIAGLLLLVYMLRHAGVTDIAVMVRRLGGGGFLAVVALSGIRLLARSMAWTRCVESPHRLSVGDAFMATVMGEALGNLTPLATFLSEPSKAAFVRGKLPLGASLPALIVENIFYVVSVALVIGIGAVAFLVSCRMSEPLRIASLGAIGGVVVVVAAAYAILGRRARPVSRTIDWLGARRIGGRWLETHFSRVRRFEARVNSFTSRNRSQLLPLVLLEGAFNVAGIAETYVTLLLIGAAGVSGLLSALVLESAGRVINAIFRFVPMRVGVDEAGSGLLASALDIGAASGVTLALVRKGRLLVWTGLGIALLVHRGLSVRRALDEAEEAAATSDPPSSLRPGCRSSGSR
jgi:hypothetical protein